MNFKNYYKRKLPHLQHPGMIFFVTFRLEGSIPKVKLQEIKEQYEIEVMKIEKETSEEKLKSELQRCSVEYFKKYDSLLDSILYGPVYFKNSACMEILKEQLHRFDGEYYDLICYTIMSNHVHILIDTSIQLAEGYVNNQTDQKLIPLNEIMRRIKGASARYINKHLNKTGTLWESESYDIYIRNEKMLDNVISYILENPVKAGLVKEWDSYEAAFISMQLRKILVGLEPDS